MNTTTCACSFELSSSSGYWTIECSYLQASISSLWGSRKGSGEEGTQPTSAGTKDWHRQSREVLLHKPFPQPHTLIPSHPNTLTPSHKVSPPCCTPNTLGLQQADHHAFRYTKGTERSGIERPDQEARPQSSRQPAYTTTPSPHVSKQTQLCLDHP